MVLPHGSLLVHADAAGFTQLHWMTPPAVLEEDGAWVAVEIKRIGTLDAVEQLTRYLERIRPELDGCRGVLAAQTIKPQARTLAEARGIRCVEVDLAVLRGEREPELTLFAE